MSKMGTTRRKFISYLGGVALLPYVACSTKPKARVVIVGGGFAGAVCANYIKSHDPAIEVLLVEKQANYMTCPTSNYVIGGFNNCLLYTSPSPRDLSTSRMPSSA